MHNLIESHTHVEMMPYEAYAELAMKGITKIITHSCYSGASKATTLFDHYKQLLTIYTNNAKRNGIKLFVTVGIHPAGIPEDWIKVLDAIPQYLQNESVIGIGEVGLHFDTKLEAEVLEKQVELAKKFNCPIDVHLPAEKRIEVVKKTLNILAKVGISPEKVVIQHVHTDVVDLVNEFGAYLGLSIGEGRLTPADVLRNAHLFGKGMLNGDYVNFTFRQYDAVPRTVHWLITNGAGRTFVENIAFRNAQTCWQI